MAKCIQIDMLVYEIVFIMPSFYLLISTANSESESEASYASVPRRSSTDSATSNTAKNRYR